MVAVSAAALMTIASSGGLLKTAAEHQIYGDAQNQVVLAAVVSPSEFADSGS